MRQHWFEAHKDFSEDKLKAKVTCIYKYAYKPAYNYINAYKPVYKTVMLYDGVVKVNFKFGMVDDFCDNRVLNAMPINLNLKTQK